MMYEIKYIPSVIRPLESMRNLVMIARIEQSRTRIKRIDKSMYFYAEVIHVLSIIMMSNC